MMDLNDANQFSQRSHLRKEGDKLEQELASNNAPEEISNKVDSEVIAEDEKLELETASNNTQEKSSEKIYSESNADDEKTSPLHRQQNGYFEKETESCEIIENICQSFNAFQKTIVDVDKSTLPNDAFYDHASIIERSPTSCAYGNLLPHISESRIHDITETAKRNNDIDKEGTFLHNALNDYISINESSPTSGTSGNLLPNTLESRIQVIAAANVKETGTIPTQASSTMESSTSGSTIIPKGEKLSPISNAGFYQREMHCDVFKEDDDWDIYQPGFVANDKTESLQESRFSFERMITINAEYLTKSESKCSVDYIPCQRVSPYIQREKKCSSSNNFFNNGRTFPESTEERMLQEVKEFFLNYPVHAIPYLNYWKRKTHIFVAPYYSNDFALRHDLPLPIISPILKLKLPKDPEKIRSLFAGYELIQNLGVSEEGFFQYIYSEKQRHVDPLIPTSIELNPYTIWELDRIQDLVGADIFNMIYGQLKRDENYQALFRDEELLARACLYWCELAEIMKHFDEQPTNIGDDQADNISDAVSEDIRFLQTNSDFPSSTSPSHVINTPGLNDLESNSSADDDASDDIFVSRTNLEFQSTSSQPRTLGTAGLNYLDPNSCTNDGKNSQYSTDLPKVQSVNPIDFLEIELECPPTTQSANQDNNENPRSIDLFQVHLDKSKESPNPAPFMLPPIQNSFHQNDEETSREDHFVTPNNATHSSDQTFKGKSKDGQSEKSFEVLPNVSKELPRVRKYISEGDNAKSRKKIRLQGNPNFGQPKSYKEDSRRKEESRTPSQDSWPIKPRKKSCIVM